MLRSKIKNYIINTKQIINKIATKADVPLIVDENIAFSKSINSNNLNSNPQIKFIRSKTRKKKMCRQKSIHIKTNGFGQDCSVIEEKLPNPYTITEHTKRQKIIEYNVKSKYKSMYADYLNHTSTFDATKNDIKIKTTIKNFSSKIEPYIYFTNTTHNNSFDATRKTKTTSKNFRSNI